MGRFLPSLTATRLQATTYLLGIALFSISFLVFLNSSISFVVTDVIGQKERVGDAVGTLGFADELLALVACPLWGILSDRIGVRTVAVTGYIVVGVSLVCLVQSTNVYPELLLGRLGFSIGGAACSTMVTAVLPSMVARREAAAADEQTHASLNGHAERLRDEEQPSRNGSIGHAPSPSINSELTITPARWTSHSPSHLERNAALPDPLNEDDTRSAAGSSQLAGFVGMFTGLGALLALGVFLPLPARFQGNGATRADSVKDSFYIVAAVAFCVGFFILLGLRNLPGEESKSLSALFTAPKSHHHPKTHSPQPSYLALLKDSITLGLTDQSIGLGYLGGFVARASSVGISLFIPLFVNAYFIRSGLCTSDPHDPTAIKASCRRAYIVASVLTGVSQLAALLCAPLFGYLGGRAARNKSEWPLMGAAAVGVVGFIAFGLLERPDVYGSWAFLSVIAVGIAQIGAIVCSLALLSRGINRESQQDESKRPGTADTVRAGESETGPIEGAETAPLLPTSDSGARHDRSHLKGTIAGMYSLSGGAGILLLTKLGGALFDSWSPGAPFFMLAGFNGLLLLAVAGVGAGSAVRGSRRKGAGEAG